MHVCEYERGHLATGLREETLGHKVKDGALRVSFKDLVDGDHPQHRGLQSVHVDRHQDLLNLKENFSVCQLQTETREHTAILQNPAVFLP